MFSNSSKEITESQDPDRVIFCMIDAPWGDGAHNQKHLLEGKFVSTSNIK